MANKYNEMTMVELKAEMVKHKKELANVEKVINTINYSFVNDMKEWMTNLMKGTNVEINLVKTNFISMRVPGQGRYEINLRLEYEYPNGDDGYCNRVIKVDTMNIGDVSNGDVEKVNYILAMGVVVQKLDAILARFTNSNVLSKLSDERRKSNSISWEIEKIEDAMRERKSKK